MDGEIFSAYLAKWKEINQEFLLASLPFKDRQKHIQQVRLLLEDLPTIEQFTKDSEKQLYSTFQEHKKNLLQDQDLNGAEPFVMYCTLKTLMPDVPAKELSDIVIKEFDGIKSSFLEIVGKVKYEVPDAQDKAQYAKNLAQYSGKMFASSLSSLFEKTKEGVIPATPQERLIEIPFKDLDAVIGGTRFYVSRQCAQACRQTVEYFLQSSLEDPLKKAIIKETLLYALERKEDVFSHFISTVLVRDPLLAKEVVPSLRSLYEAG